MKSDELLDMIGEVDDSLIAEAKNENEITDIRDIQSTKKRRMPSWAQFAAMAAGLCLIAVLSWVISLSGKKTEEPGDGVRLVAAADLMDGVEAGNVTVTSTVKAYSEDVYDYSARLFKTCVEAGKDGENVLVSPFSTLLALSMTANGAQGKTLSEMEEALGNNVGRLNEFSYLYLKSLEKDDALKLANSVWLKVDPAFSVKKNFLQMNADYYNAQMYSEKFDLQTAKKINSWVNEKTDSMIPAIMDESKAPDGIMYLINALSFDAEWKTPYEEFQVSDDEFTLNNGEKKTVSFLNGIEHVYIKDDQAVGFLKYYKGSRYAFAAILPNEGISVYDYLDSLNGAHLKEMIDNAERKDAVLTSIPKFRVEYSEDLASKILPQMGIKQAFDVNDADFGKLGTYEGENIYIDTVIHKTHLVLDENGTKAGAATSVALSYGSFLADTPSVYLNRPFIYMIIDCDANIPLFIGVMNDPS